MWPENLGVLVYGVVEKDRKITVSGPIKVIGMCNCFLANLKSFQSDCLSGFLALLYKLCFFLVCLLKLRRNQGSLWHEVLVRYAGIHYASKPLLKHVPLCIHGFVLHYFEVSCKFLVFYTTPPPPQPQNVQNEDSPQNHLKYFLHRKDTRWVGLDRLC